MQHSVALVVIHIVFSTKYRTPWLKESIRPELFAYMAGIARRLGCYCYRVGGTEDHVHLAIGLAKECSLATLVHLLKSRSSQWLRSGPGEFSDFSWQIGYGAFAIEFDRLRSLCNYIQNQETHHSCITFEEELRDLLPKGHRKKLHT